MVVQRFAKGLLPRRIRPADAGERVALRHLEREGWTVIAANLRVASGEADLLFRDFLGRPVLVEVKSGHASRLDSGPESRPDSKPESSLDPGMGPLDDPGTRAGPAKIRRLAAIAEELSVGLGAVPRIDLVTVRLGTRPEVIRHDRGLGLPDRPGSAHGRPWELPRRPP